MQSKAKMVFEKSTRTRDRIFQAGMQIMEEVGFQGATIRGICKKAGVSPATFYSYYNTKSDLLQEFYKVSDPFFEAEIPKKVQGLSFEEQIRAYVREYAVLNIHTGLESMRVLYNPANEWFATERPMQRALIAILEYGKAENKLPREVDVHALVKTVFIMLRGVCFDWCVCDGSYDLLEEMLRQLQNLLFGLVPRPAAQ